MRTFGTVFYGKSRMVLLWLYGPFGRLVNNMPGSSMNESTDTECGHAKRPLVLVYMFYGGWGRDSRNRRKTLSKFFE